MGERSSWLTSEANRASRSMRSCTASAMSLKEVTSRSRSGSCSGSRRVSRPPEASSLAASATRDTGRRSRRLADHPTAAASRAATALPEHERAADHAEAAGQRSQREDLEVLDVELGDVDADGQVGLPVEDEALAAGVAVQDVLAQGLGQVGVT